MRASFKILSLALHNCGLAVDTQKPIHTMGNAFGERVGLVGTMCLLAFKTANKGIPVLCRRVYFRDKLSSLKAKVPFGFNTLSDVQSRSWYNKQRRHTRCYNKPLVSWIQVDPSRVSSYSWFCGMDGSQPWCFVIWTNKYIHKSKREDIPLFLQH